MCSCLAQSVQLLTACDMFIHRVIFSSTCPAPVHPTAAAVFCSNVASGPTRGYNGLREAGRVCDICYRDGSRAAQFQTENPAHVGLTSKGERARWWLFDSVVAPTRTHFSLSKRTRNENHKIYISRFVLWLEKNMVHLVMSCKEFYFIHLFKQWNNGIFEEKG